LIEMLHRAVHPSLVKLVPSVTTASVAGRRSYASGNLKPPVRVAVTGPAGNIGYAALFRIASGEMLGPDQPVILQCLELPQSLAALKGVQMELEDCAFPLLKGFVATDDAHKGFEGADYALLIGARPRTKGMERADLLKANAAIFQAQGKALNAAANRKTLKVVVVGNPANTNALIASANAPDINPTQFSALTTLDHLRGLGMLAQQANCAVTDIHKFAIWGNHSPTMYADLSHCTIKGKPALQVVSPDWYKGTFLAAVGQRGAAVIAARGGSSAASAANAAIRHMRDWALGTNGEWTSMAVCNSAFGMTGTYYSFPVVCSGGNYKIVEGLKIDAFSQEKMQASQAELLKEKEQTAEFR